MLRGPMYSISDYGRMLADRVRVDAYSRALAAAIKPGAVVVDLGAGTGFFSLEACRLGASKVYAVETNDAIALLPAMAKRAGYADRIEVIQRSSTELTLEKKADVVVADLRGVVPLFHANFAIMADARARLLAHDGIMIPTRDVLHAGVVHAPDLYASIVEGWEEQTFDLRDARHASVNAFHSDRERPIGKDALATTSAPWAELVYGASPPDLVEGSLSLTATRDAVAHGIALWFDATLAEGIGYSSATSERVYSRGFLPFEAPVSVEQGDLVEVELAARRGMGDHAWAWSTTVRGAGEVKASFRQSTFLGLVQSKSSLAKELAGYLPVATPRARALAALIHGMDGRTPLEALAAEMYASAPGAFASLDEAVVQARYIVKKYG